MTTTPVAKNKTVTLKDSWAYIDTLNEEQKQVFAKGVEHYILFLEEVQKLTPEQTAKFLRNTGEPNLQLEAYLEEERKKAEYVAKCKSAPWWKFWYWIY